MKKLKTLLQGWLEIDKLEKNTKLLKRDRVAKGDIELLFDKANFLESRIHELENTVETLKKKLSRSEYNYTWWESQRNEFLKQVQDWVNKRLKKL